MCLSVYNEIVQPANKPLFGMVDSDTIVPFKTLYLSSLLMSSNHLEFLVMQILLWKMIG